MKTKKGMGYKPKNVNLILEETGLGKLIDVIEKVDFMLAFYADKPEILKKINNLRACLSSEGLEDKYTKIREELNRYEPTNSQKISIIILNLLEVTESMDIKLGLFYDGHYKIYTEEIHYWKTVEDKNIQLFLSALAEKSGLPRSESLKRITIDELKYQFDLLSQINVPKEESYITKINFQNGTFVVTKDGGKLREHRAEDYLEYILPFAFEPEAKCPTFEAFLNRAIPEKECQMLLAEFAAYPLIRGLKLEKALVLYGPGGTGKSTFTTCISRMYGEDNIGAYSLSSLCGTKESCSYNRADLKKYILNYSTEMGGKDCDSNIVKKIISREPVEARRPYGEPFILRDYCPLMFNVNEMPSMENSGAMRRRFDFVPFINLIQQSDMDVEFADKITEKELSGIFNWTLGGLKRLLKNKKFTISPMCEDIKRKLWIESDNVLAFIDINKYVKNTEAYELSTYLYSKYKEFCKENNYKSLSCIRFLKRLEELGYIVDRKATNHNIRIYCMQVKDTEIKDIEEMRNDELNRALKNI